MTCFYCVVCGSPSNGDKTCGRQTCDEERQRSAAASAAFWKEREIERLAALKNVISLADYRKRANK